LAPFFGVVGFGLLFLPIDPTNDLPVTTETRNSRRRLMFVGAAAGFLNWLLIRQF
jgi:hypothetical protein